MARCSVCGAKFAQEIQDGNVVITETYVTFHDDTRNCDLFRHEGCNQADYVTKQMAEANAQKEG